MHVIEFKYQHEASIWYSGRHVAMMDDQLDYFTMDRPPRDVGEELEDLSKNLKKSMQVLEHQIRTMPAKIERMNLKEKWKGVSGFFQKNKEILK